METDFLVQLITRLDTSQAVTDINKLRQELEKNNIKLKAVFDTSASKQKLQNLAVKLQKVLSENGLDIDTNKILSSLKQVQEQVETVANKINFSMDDGHGISDYQNRINELINDFERYGVAAIKAKNETKNFQDILGNMKTISLNNKLKETESSMRGNSRSDSSSKIQISPSNKTLKQWASVSTFVMYLISKTKAAISEIKTLDSILTEVGNTSNMTDQQLKQLGTDSYDSASKYGRTAKDYLTGIQSMNRAGYYGEKGTKMAEQSLLAQSAGNLSAESADRYVLATNAAYKLNGEAEKINAVLDGQNSITNRNSLSMEDMAAAMIKVGSVAAGYKVKIEDLSAMIGTMEAVTRLGGDEVGNAGNTILTNLQNINSSKIVNTLSAANVSMTEMVNGTKKLRDPISILRDLATTFNQLDEDDPLRDEILTNIGQKYHADELGALLQNMDMYDKMLVDYSEGKGSALEDTNKSAENLTGTFNKLSNSWTEFVNSIFNSGGLKTGADLLNGFVEGLTKLTNAITPLGTIGLGAGLFAGIQNVGRDKMFSLNCFEYADNNMCSLGY